MNNINAYEKQISLNLHKLPIPLKKEALDFINFLLSQAKKRQKKHMRFNWEGGLKELKKDFSAVELQKKSLEWR
ncbi:DUF2281 domain-containing protein [Candidatus Margulisiibacteriota bacterium]